MFKRRNLMVFAGLIALIAAGYWFFVARSESDSSRAAAERTAAVERDTIEVTVPGTGELEAEAQAELSFTASGNVGNVHVEVGQKVERGEALIELDPATLDPSLLSAEVELLQAEQQLDELLEENNLLLQLAEARKSLADAREALDNAQYRLRVNQPGNRATENTIEAAEARLTLADEKVERAQAAFNRVEDRPADDPDRAQALANLTAARDERRAALASLNWYKGEPTDIEQAQLEANVAVAEAQVVQARERVNNLQEGPDPDELATARARVRAAEARVEQFKLMAPFDGTVLAVYFSVGDSVTPGRPAVVVADTERLHVETPIDELDIASLELGQPVTLTLDALPEVTLEGEVVQIDLFPELSGTATEYPVRVALTSVDDRARIGMTAAVNILVERKEGALVIPNWALRFDPDTSDVFVMVQTAEGPSRRDVRLGLRNENVSEVVEGLQPGDVVVGSTTEEPSSFPGPFGGGG